MTIKRTLALALGLALLAGGPALAAPSPADVIRQAEALAAAGMPQIASDLLDAGTRQFPKDVALFHALGQAKERQGDDWRARNAYEEALKLNAKHSPSIVALAVLRAKDGFGDDVLPMLRQAQKLAPNDSRVLGALGHMLADEKPDEAEALLQRAVKLDPRNADALVDLAISASRRGEMDLYRQRMTAALDARPDHLQALKSLGVDLVDTNTDVDQGFSLLRRAFDLKPQDADGAQTLLDRLQTARRWTDMEAVARKWASAGDPEGVQPWHYVAAALEGQGRLAEASDVLTGIVKRSEGAVDALIWQARLEDRLGRWVAAEALYKEAMARSDGRDPVVLEAYATALEARAAALYEQATTNKDDVAASYAAVEETHRRMQEAIGLYRQLVKLDPDTARYALSLAAALVKVGEKPEAKQVLQQAAKRHPDDADVKAALKAL